MSKDKKNESFANVALSMFDVVDETISDLSKIFDGPKNSKESATSDDSDGTSRTNTGVQAQSGAQPGNSQQSNQTTEVKEKPHVLRIEHILKPIKPPKRKPAVDSSGNDDSSEEEGTADGE